MTKCLRAGAPESLQNSNPRAPHGLYASYLSFPCISYLISKKVQRIAGMMFKMVRARGQLSPHALEPVLLNKRGSHTNEHPVQPI